MKKTLFALTLLLSISLATGQSTLKHNFETNNTELQPGEYSHFGELNVTFNGTYPGNEFQAELDIPPSFETEWKNTNFTGNGNETFSSDLYLKPPSYFTGSGTSSNSVTFPRNDGGEPATVSFTAPYQVKEQSNWTMTPENVSGSYNVGEQGQIIGNFTFSQKLNQPMTNIDYNVTGNVSKILESGNGQLSLPATQNRTIKVYADIAEDQQWGIYKGQFVAKSGDINRTAGIEINVSDITAPEIGDLNFEEIMATRTGELTFLAEDNVEMGNVTAEIYRVPENESKEDIKKGSIEFENEDGVYRSEFSNTSEIGSYRANVTAYDTTGNRRYKSTIFEVVPLNTVNVTAEDFELSTVRVSTQEEERWSKQSIIDVDSETDFNLTLEYWTQNPENVSMTMRVRKPDQDVGKRFDFEEGEKLQFEDAEGEYMLEVKSSEPVSYDGRLSVGTIEQHVDTSKIRFTGLVVDPEYLPSKEFSIGRFQGEIGYVNPNSTEKNRIEFRGTAPIQNCEGANYWRECITGFTLGEWENLEEENESLRDSLGSWKLATFSLIALNMISFFLIIRKNQLKGFNSAYAQVDY